MNAAAERIQAPDAIAEEDLARADVYALVAQLFYAPPDAALLHSLASAGDLEEEGADGLLSPAWSALRRAASACDAVVLREEYDALFVGVGQSCVSPYALTYMDGAARRPHPLAALRETLAGLGLARSARAGEPEDHVAALADVMRHLIVDGARPEADRQRAQARFFSAFIEPWYAALCDAIEARAPGSFYRSVSCFTRAFLDLERASLRMEIS